MYQNTKQDKDFFDENQIPFVDYKDVKVLSQFVNQHGRIQGRKRSKLTAKHQREVAEAIKRSRYMGLMPYIAY